MTDTNGNVVPVPPPQDGQIGTAALDNCAAVWRIGFFESDAPPADDGVEHAVPPLQGCLRSDRVPAVFPRGERESRSAGEFCAALGLLGPAGPVAR